MDWEILTYYNPFRYRGYFYDVETQWYYLQSRYYNPEWGRFINADGIIGSGGFIGQNLFAYCASNPVMFCDCTGMCYHNGVAQGMGADCPNCMAGITQPDYDKIPKAPPSTSGNYTDWEEYYVNEVNQSSLDDSGFSDIQTYFTLYMNSFTIMLGGVVDASCSVGAVSIGYLITTPVAISFHIVNPNLSTGEKGIMIGYEVETTDTK